MSFFGIFKSKPATIVSHDIVTDEIQTSADFASVNQANHALSIVVNQNPDIVALSKGINEYDGFKYDTLIQQNKKGLFHQTSLEVFPTDIIE